MNVYAFDVDHTLEIAQGPVKIRQMETLRNQGHIVGLCGNWAVFCHTFPHSWGERISFFGPLGSTMTKDEYLSAIRYHIRADKFILIGNSEPGQSRDKEAAEKAGWSFVKEDQFKEGLHEVPSSASEHLFSSILP